MNLKASSFDEKVLEQELVVIGNLPGVSEVCEEHPLPATCL